MVTEDQREVIEFLGSSATHHGARVERIDTHASIVFLAGERAWKLKRAVRYDYLDYSTIERRRGMCEAEVRVNRRTAPMLYLGVVPVTRGSAGALELDGQGTVIDWLVSMVRFDEGRLLDRVASRHALDIPLAASLGSAIATFHASAETRFDLGGAAALERVVEGNERGFADAGRGILEPEACIALTRDLRARLASHRRLLDQRRADGCVRHCHGDLHLRNIVLLDPGPTLFDAVEFNDDIAVVDVLYDLAFLLMDLERRTLPAQANAVWNAYMTDTEDVGGVALMPLFLSCRAAIRAKTSASAAVLEADAGARGAFEVASREYLALAQTLLRPLQPCVVAIGGLSGSGKSTLARHLALHLGALPGALVIRSDDVRKRLAGVTANQRLGSDRYSAEMSARVYDRVIERVVAVARAGGVAIADAAFLEGAQRMAVERAAADAGLTFVGLWLEAPEPRLIERVSNRQGDVSDADPTVVRQQSLRDLGDITWHRLQTDRSVSEVTAEAIDVIGHQAPQLVNVRQL
jgi:aminoglycoside phosphotransferase family enzyme/predicted kinase